MNSQSKAFISCHNIRPNITHTFMLSLISNLVLPHNGQDIPFPEYLASSTNPNHSQGEQK